MAFITLDRIWVHRAVNPSQYVTFEAHKLSEPNLETGNEARRYGDGRVRGVTIPGTITVIQLELGYEDRDKFKQLKGWAKEKLMFRDLKGRREWGVLGAISEHDFGHGYHDQVMWTVPFHVVTYEESLA